MQLGSYNSLDDRLHMKYMTLKIIIALLCLLLYTGTWYLVTNIGIKHDVILFVFILSNMLNFNCTVFLRLPFVAG